MKQYLIAEETRDQLIDLLERLSTHPNDPKIVAYQARAAAAILPNLKRSPRLDKEVTRAIVPAKQEFRSTFEHPTARGRFKEGMSIAERIYLSAFRRLEGDES